MLWFNFIFGLKIFKPVWFLFFIVLYSLSQSETKGNTNQTGLKNFKPNIKLNHNIYMYMYVVVQFGIFLCPGVGGAVA